MRIDLESIMLNEVSQMKSVLLWQSEVSQIKHYDFTYMWNLTTKQMSKHNKTETESDTENQQVVARGERGGKMGKIGEGN